MVKEISSTGKSRGRPSTGATSVHLRVLPDQAAAIDGWIVQQHEPDLSRPEAIRRLVELGLTVKLKARPRSQDQKDRAWELAGKVIDKIADAGASDEDKAVRKQRLLKGPSIVRDVRVDRKGGK